MPWQDLFPWLDDVLIVVDIVILVGVVIAIYLLTRRKSPSQDAVFLAVLRDLTNQRLRFTNWEDEVHQILARPDRSGQDRVELLLQQAPIVDILGSVELEEFFQSVAATLSHATRLESSKILALLRQREQEYSMALTPFVAIPHIIVEGSKLFTLLIARCTHGIRFSAERPAVKAVFVILGTQDERELHLKLLAALAKIVQTPEFEQQCLLARNEDQLRELLLRKHHQQK